MKDGLVVQLARSDPYSSRRAPRGSYRGGYRRGYGARGGGPGYGYGGPYPPPRGRGGYGYPGYGYERGGYGGGYGGPYPSRLGREPYYGGYGGPYGREAYGYRGYDDYRAAPDDRDPGYDHRDRYHGDRRRDSDRNYENGRPGPAEGYNGRDGGEPREESHGGDDYARGRYSRSASPKRDRSRSRSPSR